MNGENQGAGKVEECRICGCRSLREVLDLGGVPPVDSFLSEDELGEEEIYPLELVACDDCGLVQLGYAVPREELFHGDYAYDMSVTDAGVRHFHTMAEELNGRYQPGSILDIGSNTGVLLEGFRQQGVDVLGVEPSENVYRKAVERGIPTENIFFSRENAGMLRHEHGRFDLVTGTNVFAHVENLHGFVEGLKEVLEEDGVFVFETPYLVDLMEKNEFDTIYHEHLSYFSLKPLTRLFDDHRMEITDIEKQDIHGGSLRIHVARKGEREPGRAVEEYLETEREKEIHSDEVLEDFAERVENNRRKLVEMVEELSSGGNSIAGVGAPAKGVVLLNYCGFDRETIPYVTEKSDLKIGSYVPGTHNQVVPDERLLEDVPDYALLLPWNFADSIMENLEEYLEKGGRFIIPVPEPHVVDSLD